MNHHLPFNQRYGPWALVTGASSGIGREIALQCAARGLHVLLSGRDARRLEAVAHDIRAMGRQASWVVADLSSAVGVDAVLDKAQSLEIGLLVPAAGFGTGGPFLEMNEDDLLEMLQVNCQAVTRLVRRLAPAMAERRRGGVVLVASLLAFHGIPYAAPYAATKAYIQSLGEALAVELAGSGVDVLVSSPGPTETGFAERARMRLGKTMAASDIASATLRTLGRSSTLLPGGLTKLLHGALLGVPRAGKVRVMGRIMRGMTHPA